MKTGKTRFAGLIGAALSLGVAQAHAFRTAADLPEFAGSTSVNWAPASVRMVLNANGAPGLPTHDVETALVNAFATWSSASCSELTLDYGGLTFAPALPDDATNTLEWLTTDWTEHGFSPDEAAVTDVQYEKDDEGGWHIVEADIHMNAVQHGWMLSGGSGPDARDVASVLTHEVGHVLGLLHPCEMDGVDGAPDCGDDEAFERALMYPAYNPSRLALSADDEDGVCFLYPGARCEIAGCAAGERCTDSGCRAECGEALCAAGEICESETCKARRPDCGGACDPGACASDADCAGGFACRDGLCRGAAGERGDACRDPSHCIDGACSEDGECSTPCSSDAHCELGDRCDGNGACAPSRERIFGGECASGQDCASGLCLAGLTDPPVCTSACGTPDSDCPEGWECALLDGRAACVPERSSDDGAWICGIARHAGSGDWTAWGAVPLVLWFLTGRARRSRARVELDRRSRSA